VKYKIIKDKITSPPLTNS